MALPWGRRFLLCPPEHFQVLYEINPWMHAEVAVDPERARAQWEAFAQTLRDAGATLDTLTPQPDLPDMVFTANAGVVNGTRFVPSRFRHPQRQAETPHYMAWFAAQGYDVRPLPDGLSHEGAGDALPFGGGFVSGYRFRSDAAAHVELSRLLGAPVHPVELTDSRFYHFDLTFCPLDGRRALAAPHAWDSYGRKVIAAAVAEPFELDADETASFCANSIVVGTAIVMPACPPRVGRQLEAWGFDVAVVDVSEFLKAGGACRCLTLALDVSVPA